MLSLVLALACTATACTPTLDWREVRPDGGLVALFPCKPASHARKVGLAGVVVEMTLHACSAGGATYAVGSAELGQAPLIGAALVQMRAAAASNIGAAGSHAVAPLLVAGMTPNPQAGRQVLAGRLADGRPVEEQVALFARGTRVFQATVVGARLDVEAIETFFGALRLPP